MIIIFFAFEELDLEMVPTEQLKLLMDIAAEEEDYDKAIAVRDELNKRKRHAHQQNKM
jgi:uncharacterized protein YqgQ